MAFSCILAPFIQSVYFAGVSTKAEAILEQVRKLPPEEQEQLRKGILELLQRQRDWDEQKIKLHKMQSRHAGRGLLTRLLEERVKERARG